MRRLGTRILAITMAAAMMTSLTPQASAFLHQEIVYAAEAVSNVTIDGSEEYSFNSSKGWEEGKQQDISVTTDDVPTVGTVITADILIPVKEDETEPTFTGEIKSQGIMRLGSDWVWVQSKDIPALSASDFKDKVTDADGKQYFKASVSYQFGEEVCANNPDWSEEAPFSDVVKDKVSAVTFKIIGSNSNYSGKIAVANTKVCIPAADVTIGSSDTYKFSSTSPWDDVAGRTEAKEQSMNFTTDYVPTVGSTLSVDVLLPVVAGKDKPDFAGSIKTQGILRLGTEWTFIQSQDIPELKAENFSEKVKDTDGNEYYKATVSYTFGEKVGANNPEWENDAPFKDVVKEPVAAISVKFAGCNCDYSGKIAIAGAAIKVADAPLEKQDPTILSDLKDSVDFQKWSEEGGWDYYHGGAENTSPKIAYDEANQRLKVSLDYSANKSSTWSEAKVKCTVPTPVSIKNYNQISVDLIYKDVNPVSKIKFYAKDKETDKKEVINVYGAVDASAIEDLENGLHKVTVTLNIKPADCTVDNITIGLIGYETDFKGDVYLDNLTLSQYDDSGDYVDITSIADNAHKTSAKTEGMIDSVSLADKQATANTLALYSYLKNLDKNDQVLFGHQNDTHKSVNTSAADGSDTKDMTNSISGVVGIDSLALTGAELGLGNTEEAVQTAIEIDKAAADQGAIITLSMHMPNMSNAKVVPKEGGGYDFSKCDFAESKDLTNMKNNGAVEVLPGGTYNAQFTAYLDIIAEYAKGLGDIPVLFRPFHEGDGSWFWWGSATTDNETYKALYRYTEDYLTSKGVHNFIYVYSPCGPANAATYENRYPGDDYVDVLSFDYYDDYSSADAEYSDEFFKNLESACNDIYKLAKEKGKVAAIAEAGVRVMKKDGSDQEGILVKDNPIKGQNWYSKINDVAAKTGMSYFLLWANFSDTNFYIPYKYNDTKGQELINEFIDFYNEDSSIFADGTNFYNEAVKTVVTNTNKESASGYFTNVASKDVIKEEKTITATVKNAENVSFVLTGGKSTETLEAVKNVTTDQYKATITTDILDKIGVTDNGTISLVADGTKLLTLDYISFGKDKETLPQNVIDNFDLYYGDSDYLGGNFSSNSGAGCSSTITLDKGHAQSGDYAGAFTYTLKGNGSYTGKIKSEDYDFSEYNALSMWVKPDGQGQKLIIQIGDASGEEYEANLTDFVKGTTSGVVTIPFSSFKAKGSGVLDPSKITKFAIYCNKIDKDLTSTIYFDDIQAVQLTAEEIANADANGLIIAYDSTSNSGSSDTGSTSSTTTTETKPDGSKVETKVETKPDGSKVETVTTTKPDGTQSIVVSEQETNEAGKTVAVTTTTEKDAKGNVTGTTEEKVIAEADKNTSVTVTTKTDSEGQSEVTASVVKTGTKTVSGTNSTISSAVVAQITEAAGTEDAVITQKVVDKAGKTICTTMVNASDLTPGSNLKIFKYNTKTGEYTLVNKKDYKVTGKGGIKLTMKSSGTFMFLNQKDADEVVNKILATVKSANASKTLSKGKTANFVMSKKLNMANVAKITYSSSESSVAKIDKNGKITAKKAGTAIVKAKVTLKNGKTKTISMKVKVK